MYSNKFSKKDIINFTFYFINYHDMNVTLFSKRFPTIEILMKFNTEQKVCCRELHRVHNEKCIYNGQYQKDSDIVYLFYIEIHDPAIYLIWRDHVVQRILIDTCQKLPLYSVNRKCYCGQLYRIIISLT